MSNTTQNSLTQSESEEDNHNLVQNRSQFVIVWDGADVLFNGDPMSSGNRQRIDPQTQQAIATDVRIKRYVRDQLVEDGHDILVKQIIDSNGNHGTREDLVKDVLNTDIKDSLRNMTEEEDIDASVFDAFLNAAADVRLFGATLSLQTNEDLVEKIADRLPSSFEGPVQLLPARSLNAPVEENTNYNSLTSVVAPSEGKAGGGMGLDDNRIKYAVMNTGGVVNEQNARETLLTEEDVRRFDTTLWRSLLNQTRSRSKTCQVPRLYLRVEYKEGYPQVGRLHQRLAIDDDRSKPPKEMRSIDEVTIDATDLITQLNASISQIKRIHINADPLTEFSVDDTVYNGEEFVDFLSEKLGEDAIHRIDVNEEAQETMPN